MPVYTRSGDTGETGLIGPRRVGKHHPRVEAFGAVDELNAWLGLARAECAAEGRVAELPLEIERQQRLLLQVGAELARDPATAPAGKGPAEPGRVTAEEVARLEALIDRAEAELPPLRSFVIPGGSRPAALLHVARTVARRAERRVVALAHAEPVRPEVIAYLNRLSDLLFVWSRLANHRMGQPDALWRASPGGPPGP